MNTSPPPTDPGAESFDQIKPSAAYDQATDSPVYRLSELMFGSLLASYVLGFIGFLATQIGIHPSHERWDIFLLAVKYTSISLAYAYLTASFYLSYHAGILTMHHMPLKRLGFDFILALVQAVFFGYSMLFPRVFPIHLAVVLGAAIFRQKMEHRRHVGRFFSDRVGVSPAPQKGRHDPGAGAREYRRRFVKLLDAVDLQTGEKKYAELGVWKPAGRSLTLVTILLLILGTLIWYLVGNQEIGPDWYVLSGWRLSGGTRLSESYIALESSVVSAAVIYKGHRIIRDRATFLYDRKKTTTEMDEQFRKFFDELRGRQS